MSFWVNKALTYNALIHTQFYDIVGCWFLDRPEAGSFSSPSGARQKVGHLWRAMKVLGMKVDPKVLLVLVETRSALDRAEEWCRMYDAETKTGARCVALDRHASRWSAEGRLKLVAHTIF